MRKSGIIFLLSIALPCAVAFAQYPGYNPVKDIAAFRGHFSQQSFKVTSIVSDFRQTKDLVALTEKITSYGKFWFKRSNHVRIDYDKPFIYKMVMNGDKITIKDEHKQNSVNVRSNKLFQQINRIMLDCIQGTILDSKDFTSSVYENPDRFLIELKPSSKALREFFDVIVLVVERKNYSVDEIRMIESGGDNTTLTFTNKVLNQPVKDEVFVL